MYTTQHMVYNGPSRKDSHKHLFYCRWTDITHYTLTFYDFHCLFNMKQKSILKENGESRPSRFIHKHETGRPTHTSYGQNFIPGESVFGFPEKKPY